MSNRFSGVFEPEVVEAMGRAFEMATAKLGICRMKFRKRVALKIIAAAKAGEVDPQRLYAKAIGASLSRGFQDSFRRQRLLPN
jgi:hypothetical protein